MQFDASQRQRRLFSTVLELRLNKNTVSLVVVQQYIRRVCLLQDNQCGIVTSIDIDCAVKLVGTNCVLYPVNSKDLQHIWVRAPHVK